MRIKGQLFASGPVVATPGALALGVDLVPYVRRHLCGDWGNCGRYAETDLTADEQRLGALATADDAKLNVWSIRNGGRVLSPYDTAAGRLWVITDGLQEGALASDIPDGTYTTCLLPEEY